MSRGSEKFDPAAGHNGNPTLSKEHTHGSIVLTPEMFEKLYLSPKSSVKGDLRSILANPTPVGLLGLALALTPLACNLMGWRGAGGTGAASIGSYFFLGGFLMMLGGLLEFLLGNTYSFVNFCGYGGWWWTFGATLQPFFGAYAAYSPDPSTPRLGLENPEFNASFGFTLLFMGVFSFSCTLCSLTTNLALFGIELFLTLTFTLLASSFFASAEASPVAHNLQVAGGACAFVAAMCGWYLFFALMLASVNFPIQLPVGDLSHIFRIFRKNEVVEGESPV